MRTNKSTFTFGTFFLLVVGVNIIGATIFYWLGMSPEQGFGTANQTEVVMFASIVLVSISALICLATAAYVALPRVQWQY